MIMRLLQTDKVSRAIYFCDVHGSRSKRIYGAAKINVLHHLKSSCGRGLFIVTWDITNPSPQPQPHIVTYHRSDSARGSGTTTLVAFYPKWLGTSDSFSEPGGILIKAIYFSLCYLGITFRHVCTVINFCVQYCKVKLYLGLFYDTYPVSNPIFF